MHTTPSHVEFPQCCALIHMHNIGSSLSPHSFHVSSHLHGSCVLLCLSLIASTSHFFLISSLITLFFLLPVNFIFQDVVDKSPARTSLPQILQELGLAGDRKLAAWTRTDMSSRTRRTTMKGVLAWSDVVARVTADAVNERSLIQSWLEHDEISGTPSIGRRASRFSDDLNL